MNLKNSPDTSPAFLRDLQVVTSEDGARAVLIHYVDALADPTAADREILRWLSQRDGLRIAVVRAPASPTLVDHREIQMWTHGSGSAFKWMSLDDFSNRVETFLNGDVA